MGPSYHGVATLVNRLRLLHRICYFGGHSGCGLGVSIGHGHKRTGSPHAQRRKLELKLKLASWFGGPR